MHFCMIGLAHCLNPAYTETLVPGLMRNLNIFPSYDQLRVEIAVTSESSLTCSSHSLRAGLPIA